MMASKAMLVCTVDFYNKVYFAVVILLVDGRYFAQLSYLKELVSR